MSLDSRLRGANVNRRNSGESELRGSTLSRWLVAHLVCIADVFGASMDECIAKFKLKKRITIDTKFGTVKRVVINFPKLRSNRSERCMGKLV